MSHLAGRGDPTRPRGLSAELERAARGAGGASEAPGTFGSDGEDRVPDPVRRGGPFKPRGGGKTGSPCAKGSRAASSGVFWSGLRLRFLCTFREDRGGCARAALPSRDPSLPVPEGIPSAGGGPPLSSRALQDLILLGGRPGSSGPEERGVAVFFLFLAGRGVRDPGPCAASTPPRPRFPECLFGRGCFDRGPGGRAPLLAGGPGMGGGRGWGARPSPGPTLRARLLIGVPSAGVPPSQAQGQGRSSGAEGAARAAVPITERGPAADAGDHSVPGALPGALDRLGSLYSGGRDVAAA